MVANEPRKHWLVTNKKLLRLLPTNELDDKLIQARGCLLVIVLIHGTLCNVYNKSLCSTKYLTTMCFSDLMQINQNTFFYSSAHRESHYALQHSIIDSLYRVYRPLWLLLLDINVVDSFHWAWHWPPLWFDAFSSSPLYFVVVCKFSAHTPSLKTCRKFIANVFIPNWIKMLNPSIWYFFNFTKILNVHKWINTSVIIYIRLTQVYWEWSFMKVT